MTHLQRFIILVVLLSSTQLAWIQGNFIQSTNQLDDPSHHSNNEHLSRSQARYAAGESAQIVAQFSEPPVSRDIPISNPLFYGFFYGYNISDSLRLISEKYLSLSYDGVSEFSSWLNKAMLQSNVTDPFAYYQKPLDPETRRMDPYFHTTAKYCGRKPCLEYWNKAGKKYLGKPFEMHLVGLFFTKRTFGFRVKLTTEEQTIFEVDERSNTLQAVVVETGINNTSFEQNTISSNNDTRILANSSSSPYFLQPEPPGHEYEGYFHSRGEKVESHPLYPGIHFLPQQRDFHPTESRAHVTIACAKDISPEQTGLDLLEIIDLEISGGVYHKDFNIGGGDLPTSTLRRYGSGERNHYDNNDGEEMSEEEEIVFVIYPNEKMVTQATFSVYL